LPLVAPNGHPQNIIVPSADAAIAASRSQLFWTGPVLSP